MVLLSRYLSSILRYDCINLRIVEKIVFPGCIEHSSED
jgi:hypothetical protein